jgi:tRNA U34 5-methylaminomethyl-2-thiouridine-forming methyltransferase MnmC
MTGQDQTASLDWREGEIPVSTRFDDPYYSLAGGLAETHHVFLAGNGLPQRLRHGFAVAELGFGTGLNLLALARICPPDLAISFTSFEAYPMRAADMQRALAPFAELAPLAGELVAQWQAGRRAFALGPVAVQVVIGDVAQTLPAWPGRADAWFLDGFSPAKNPGMWSPQVLAAVGQHTAPGGTFATYTAAGHVRRALQAAGFAVQRPPGYGRKRHMSQGVRRDL